MNGLRSYAITFLACTLPLSTVDEALAEDWPQWMGPLRNGVYQEKGIVESIPESGLPVKWRVAIHGGYAGPAVVDGRVFLMDYHRTAGEMIETPGDRPELEGEERVLCLDAKTGEQIWEHKYECGYRISYPAGPRATTTVDQGQVFCLGAQGDLTALSADDGTVVWHVNLPKTFDAPVPIWGFSAHPLVHDDMVITMVGGEGQSVVAFNRADGTVKWKALTSEDAGYCPATVIDAAGTKQLVVWHPKTVASLNPTNGKTYWTVPLAPDYGMSISHPQREGDYLFVSGIKNKSLMLKLASDEPGVEEVWAATPKSSMSVSTMTPLIHDGVIYGCDESMGALVAARVEDGERLWHSFEPIRPDSERRSATGTAYVTRHAPSGRYLLFGESGYFSIANMDAEGFESLGKMKVLEPTQTAFGRKVVWSHPAYSGKTAFIRNDKEIVAIDLSN